MADESQESIDLIIDFVNIFDDLEWVKECEPLYHVVTGLKEAITNICVLDDSGLPVNPDTNKKTKKTYNDLRGQYLREGLKLSRSSGAPSLREMPLSSLEKIEQFKKAKAVYRHVEKGLPVEKAVGEALLELGLDESKADILRHAYYDYRLKLDTKYLLIRAKAKKWIDKI